MLLLRHPKLAKRSCEICKEYLFDEDTRLISLGRDNQPERRKDYGGDLVCPPMCKTPKGCPKGTPENLLTLNKINEQCYEHYQECVAVNQFPDDPVVRRNAAIIRECEKTVESESENQFRDEIRAMIGVK